jgi:hypothetical protein
MFGILKRIKGGKKVKKKIISIFLVGMMIISIVNPNVYLSYASTNNVNIKSQGNYSSTTISQIVDIMRKTDKFSLLIEEDASIVCKYFNVSKSDMEMLEGKSYNLEKSLNICSVMTRYGFDLQVTEKLFSTYTDTITLMKELTWIDYLKDNYNLQENEINEIKSKILYGEKVSIIANEFEKKKLKEIESEIVAKSKIENNITNKGDMSKEIKSLDLKDTNIKENSTTSTQLEATNNDNIVNFQKYFNAPFSYRKNKNEVISPGSGNLTFESEDYRLPGVNNLDLTINSMYNLNQSNIYDMSLTYTSSSYT